MGHDDLGARATAEHNGLRLSRLLVDLLPSGFERRGLILRQLVSAAALDRQHKRELPDAVERGKNILHLVLQRLAVEIFRGGRCRGA